QNLGTMATQHLDMLLIGSILSPQAAGVYKLVKNLGSLLRNFTNPLRELAYTTVSQILANDRHFSAVRPFLRRFTLGILLLGLVTAGFAALAGPWLLQVIAGHPVPQAYIPG